MDGLLEKKLSIFVESSKEKKDDQNLELQFGNITPEMLQSCSIGKENTGIYISTTIETKQSTDGEMDIEIETEVEVNITKEANSRVYMYRNY